MAADIAIYVGVGQQLELIARVATADDMETVVTVHYEKATQAPSPKAAVKASGFAKLPLNGPNSGSDDGGGPGGRGGKLKPGSTKSDGGDSDGDDSSDDGSDGPTGGSTEPMIWGDGDVATVGDRVWHDVDKNGIQDPGESGVSGRSCSSILTRW